MKIKLFALSAIVLNIIPLLFTYFFSIAGIGFLIGAYYSLWIPKIKAGKITGYILTILFSIFGLLVTIWTIPELLNNY